MTDIDLDLKGRAEEYYGKRDWQNVREVVAQTEAARRWNMGEIGSLLGEAEGLKMVVELARLYVDASKSLANAQVSPAASIGLLDEAVDVVEVVYGSRQVKESGYLEGDRLRDQAKIAEALAYSFVGDKRSKLIEKSVELNKQAGETKPNSESDSSQIVALIEAELMKVDYGKGEADWSVVGEQFDKLLSIHSTDNKGTPSDHRVATVAMWLVTRGEQDGRVELTDHAQKEFERAVEHARRENRPLGLSIEEERDRLAKKRLKWRVFGLMSLFVKPKTKQDLYERVQQW